jgi:hypothetical protein
MQNEYVVERLIQFGTQTFQVIRSLGQHQRLSTCIICGENVLNDDLVATLILNEPGKKPLHGIVRRYVRRR